MDLSEIFPKDGQVQRLYCSEDPDWLDLAYTDYSENISDIHIRIDGLPVLRCPTCGREYLPDHSRFAIITIHGRASQQGIASITVPRQKLDQRYGYTEVEFLYDSDDYRFIPGLKRDWDEGFLTPVFFNKTVLLKYDTYPGFRLTFASTTYGSIHFGDDDVVSFGLNRNNKVIMWLGDIAKLPLEEQHYLRSENILSDHSIGSQFYDAQIEAQFTELTELDTLTAARSEFLEAAIKRFGKSISHLDAEATALVLNQKRPVAQTDKECHHAADVLNKIHLEALDNSGIKVILSSLGAQAEGGSLKQLEKLMSTSAPGLLISDLMCPFYVLYDLRVAFSHLVKQQRKEQLLESICERLGLDKSSEFLVVYDAIVDRMRTSYLAFCEALQSG